MGFNSGFKGLNLTENINIFFLIFYITEMIILHLPNEILKKKTWNQHLLGLLYESLNDIIDMRDNYSFHNYTRIMDAILCPALALPTAWPIAYFHLHPTYGIYTTEFEFIFSYALLWQPLFTAAFHDYKTVPICQSNLNIRIHKLCLIFY